MTISIKKNKWTTLSLLNWSEEHLASKGIEKPRLSAELLLADVLRCERIYLYTHFDQPLLQEELQRFKKLFRRRLEEEPIQYILGHADFYGRSFHVNRSVLIPRPETEHIIEAVLEIEREKSENNQSVGILDIGTGSGIIAVTLALEIPNSRITAIDNSSATLEAAEINAVAHTAAERITFKSLDVWKSEFEQIDGEFDYLVSNPPYIPAGELENLPAGIRNFEPVRALTDGKDGYSYYHRLAETAPTLLKEGGWLIVELNDNHSSFAQEIFTKNGAKHLRTWYDLSGKQRVLGGEW